MYIYVVLQIISCTIYLVDVGSVYNTKYVQPIDPKYKDKSIFGTVSCEKNSQLNEITSDPFY